MKASVIISLIGVVGLLAFAGTVVAAGAGTQAGTSSAGGGVGGMHSGMHQNGHQYQYNQSSAGCTMDHDYNYSWDHDYGGCGGSCPRT
jgi:hypothetical protein